MSILLIVFALCTQLVVPALTSHDDCQGSDGDFSAATCSLETPRPHNGLSLIQGMSRNSPPSEDAISQVHGSCGWNIFYDKWIPAFEKGEYEGPGREGGAHCMDACCADATCKGIALMSNEMYQCYKYSELPPELTPKLGQPLGTGAWMHPLKPAWSIFVKSGGAVSAVSTVAQAGSACGWKVHYDLWVHTFAEGEYEPNNELGGVHCLAACCQDPTCDGLALMSTEESQCYKYKNLPPAAASHDGTNLGDGQWLLTRKPAWSIFVKTHVKRTASPTRSGTHSLVAPAVKQVSLGTDDIPVGLIGDVHPPTSAVAYLADRTTTTVIFHGAISIAVIGALAFMLGHLTSSTVFAKRLRNRFHSLAEESETTKLLEGPPHR